MNIKKIIGNSAFSVFVAVLPLYVYAESDPQVLLGLMINKSGFLCHKVVEWHKLSGQDDAYVATCQKTRAGSGQVDYIVDFKLGYAYKP